MRVFRGIRRLFGVVEDPCGIDKYFIHDVDNHIHEVSRAEYERIKREARTVSTHRIVENYDDDVIDISKVPSTFPVGYNISGDYALLIKDRDSGCWGFAYSADLIKYAMNMMNNGHHCDQPKIQFKFAAPTRRESIQKALRQVKGRRMYTSQSKRELVAKLMSARAGPEVLNEDC